MEGDEIWEDGRQQTKELYPAQADACTLNGLCLPLLSPALYTAPSQRCPFLSSPFLLSWENNTLMLIASRPLKPAALRTRCRGEAVQQVHET